MASIERTAYPRFKRFMSARELHVFYTPQPDEIVWAHEAAVSDEHLLEDLARRAAADVEAFYTSRGEVGVLLVARTGRWACPALDLMLYDWDGQLTAPMRKQVARHAGQCDACAFRGRSARRPALLVGMAPPAAFPRGLREKVLRLCADDSPPARAYREEVRQRAGPFAADGFPQQVRQPRGRMLALSGGAAASAILIAIVATGVIAVLAAGGSHTPRPVDRTRSHSAPVIAGTAVTGRAAATRVSPTVSPAASQPGTSAPAPVVVPSPSRAATSSPSAFPSPPPRPSASTSSACPHPLPHHRCHP